jgi:hypothetical protein
MRKLCPHPWGLALSITMRTKKLLKSKELKNLIIPI